MNLMNSRLNLCMFQDDMTPVCQFPIEPKYTTAFEHTLFQGVRKKKFKPKGAQTLAAIDPIWHSTGGKPWIEGFFACLTDPKSGQEVRCAFTTEYFGSLARQASTILVQRGDLKNKQLCRYMISAFPGTEESEDSNAGKEKSDHPIMKSNYAIRESKPKALRAFMGNSSLAGSLHAEDLPLFVPRQVLDEAADLTRKAEAVETGGILIGHLHRDTETPEVFLEITAQIPATHVRSKLTSLTFTPETWSAARSAIALRRKGEIMVGWWHAHNYMTATCKDCEKNKNHTCKAGAAFMSMEDCNLHEACFPRAFSVALVVSDSPCSGLSHTLFGWRAGLINELGFYILNGRNPDTGGSCKTENTKIQKKETIRDKEDAHASTKAP